MKTLIQLIFFLCPLLANSQAEKVHSIIIKSYPVEYYVEQTSLWQQEIKKQPNNPDGWLNYYTAARMQNILTPNASPNDLGAIVEACQKAIPNTFESNFIYSYNNGRTPEGIAHLKKAIKIDPNRPIALYDLITLYEIDRNLPKAEETSKKIHDMRAYSPGILNWNYNMLMSLEKNAILITHGDNDTYPAWLLQYGQKIRTDVMTFNLHILLGYQSYRDKIFKELNVPLLAMDQVELDKMAYKDKYELVCRHFAKHGKRPVYLGPAMPSSVRKHMSDSLYIEGLSFRYAPKAYDNIPLLVSNYEQGFRTDYLLTDWQNDISRTVLNTMNLNYLPAFMSLYRHYHDNRMMEKAEKVKSLSLAIARAGGKEDKVRKHLETYEK